MRLNSITLVIAASIKIATTDLTCSIIHTDFSTYIGVGQLSNQESKKPGIHIRVL
jgi:hypothetical protein